MGAQRGIELCSSCGSPILPGQGRYRFMNSVLCLGCGDIKKKRMALEDQGAEGAKKPPAAV
ncbi:MAG: hypothetical protein ABFE07_28840 [Armatimonadia bacterium]